MNNNPENNFTPLQLHSRAPTLYEDIYLIQHIFESRVYPKKIGFGNVTTILPGFHFKHYIDTPYLVSMGSPILTDDGDDDVLDKVLGFVYDDGSTSCPNRARKMSYEIYTLIENYSGCD